MIRQAVEKGLAKPDEIKLVGDPVPEALTPFQKPDSISLDFTTKVPGFLKKPFVFVASRLLKSYPQVDPKLCVGCGKCAEICPVSAHGMDENGKHTLNRARCKSCMRCAGVCYTGALEAVGRMVTVEEIMKELLEDEIFYRRSGGGVTATGGEALCQAEFVAELFTALQARKIHTAIETNLCLPWKQIEGALEKTDLIMFDLKTMDSALHEQTIGSSNQPVLENIVRLGKMGKQMIARTPVIPGFNDSEQEIRRIARFLQKNAGPNLLGYELLGYHPLGCDKAEQLSLEQKDFSIPSREKLAILAAAAAETGLDIKTNGHTYIKERKE